MAMSPRKMMAMSKDMAKAAKMMMGGEAKVKKMRGGGMAMKPKKMRMSRISRDTYLAIPTKTTTGRPTQFFLDRQITPNLKIWPAPENSTDVIHYDTLTRIQDADLPTNTMEIPFRFYPCLTAGLAYYIAMKKAPDRIQLLKTVYEEEFERAMGEDRDRSSFSVTPQLSYYKVG